MEQTLECISAGVKHSVCICPSTSEVFAFGNNKLGQLGIGTETLDSDKAESVRDPSTNLARWTHIPIQVATGNTHTVLLLDNGTVFGWGDVDRLGQREVGHFSFLPIQIPISAPVSFIACGSDFTLCVAEGGQVWSWGKGTSGNLGHGVALDEYTPKCIESIQDTSVYMVAAGSSHSLALTRQGVLFAWGLGDKGRLGTGDSRKVLEPVEVLAVRDMFVSHIACGEAHSACVSDTGELFMWGTGSYGRLGLGDELDYFIPTRVSSLSGVAVASASLGILHSCCVSRDGELWTWGSGKYGKLGYERVSNILSPQKLVSLSGARIVQVSAGASHTLAVGKRQLYSWGDLTNGKLGRKSTPEPSEVVVPSPVTPWVRKLPLLDPSKSQQQLVIPDAWLHTVKQVSVGKRHSMALTYRGSIFTWGCNADGQLGDGSRQDSSAPVQLNLFSETGGAMNTIGIAAGANHSLCCMSLGTVFIWGRGEEMQLGSGSDISELLPVQIQYLKHASVNMVYAGETHSAAKTTSGQLYTWGDSTMGKLGTGTEIKDAAIKFGTTPTLVRGVLEGKVVTDVSLGCQHSGCTDSSGKVYTWGSGWYGKLGLGSTIDQNVPCRVLGLEYQTITKVSCGTHHTLFLSGDKDLYVAGKGDSRLGLGLTDDCLVPELNISFRSQEISIHDCTAAENHSVAVSTNGDVYIWGIDQYGKLGGGGSTTSEGLGATVEESIPRQLKDLNLKSRLEGMPTNYYVAAYSNHNIGLCSDGTLYMWGYNGNGRLGIDTKGALVVPKPQEVSLFSARTHIEKVLRNRSGTSIIVDSTKPWVDELELMEGDVDRSSVERYFHLYIETNKTPPLFIVQLISRAEASRQAEQANSSTLKTTRYDEACEKVAEVEVMLQERLRSIIEIEKKMMALQYAGALIIDYSVESRDLRTSNLVPKDTLSSALLENISLFQQVFRSLYLNPRYLSLILNTLLYSKSDASKSELHQSVDWIKIFMNLVREIFCSDSGVGGVDPETTSALILATLCKMVLRFEIERYVLYGEIEVDNKSDKMQLKFDRSFLKFVSPQLGCKSLVRLVRIFFSMDIFNQWLRKHFLSILRDFFAITDGNIPGTEVTARGASLVLDPYVVYGDLGLDEGKVSNRDSVKSELYKNNLLVRNEVDERRRQLSRIAKAFLEAIKTAMNHLPMEVQLVMKNIRQEFQFQFSSDTEATQSRFDQLICKIFVDIGLIPVFLNPYGCFGKSFGKTQSSSLKNMVVVARVLQNTVAGRTYSETWMQGLNEMITSSQLDVQEIATNMCKVTQELSDALYLDYFKRYLRPHTEPIMIDASISSLLFLQYVFTESSDLGFVLSQDPLSQRIADLGEFNTKRIPSALAALSEIGDSFVSHIRIDIDSRLVDFDEDDWKSNLFIDQQFGVPLDNSVRSASTPAAPFTVNLDHADSDFRVEMNRTLSSVLAEVPNFAKQAEGLEFLEAVNLLLHTATDKGLFSRAAELHRLIKYVKAKLHDKDEQTFDEILGDLLASILWQKDAAARVEYILHCLDRLAKSSASRIGVVSEHLIDAEAYMERLREHRYSDIKQIHGRNVGASLKSDWVVPKAKKKQQSVAGAYLSCTLSELLSKGVVVPKLQMAGSILPDTKLKFQFTSTSIGTFDVDIVKRQQHLDKFTVDVFRLRKLALLNKTMDLSSSVTVLFVAAPLKKMLEKVTAENLLGI